MDYSSDAICGYVDFNDNIENDDAMLAKKALVFCVICVNDNWKVPITYYLINGLNAEKKANLILQCLTSLHDINFKIVSVTFDGMATNLSALKILGCNFKVDNLKTYFQHPSPKSKIFVFLDASHMLKLVRNSLGTSKTLIDINGEEIQWRYLEEFYKLQIAEGFHLENKLTVRHIDYGKQKMKVKLAAQLLNQSVPDALTFCKDILKLQTFQDSAATIKFLKIFNDLFDVFNSKSLKQHGFVKPINSDNFDKIKLKFKDTVDYINSLQLRLSSNKFIKLVDSKRRTGFLGFLINIQSLLILFEEVCEKEKILTYIPTYKLSQDHLKSAFKKSSSYRPIYTFYRELHSTRKNSHFKCFLRKESS